MPRGDPQRDKVYALEYGLTGVWDFAHTPRKSLEAITKATAKYYKIDPPALRVINSKAIPDVAWYRYERITLNKARGGANVMVLLHELAHYIVESTYETYEDHGPEFCAIYMHLLSKNRMLPAEVFRFMAKKMGVRVGRKYLPGSL